jgi:hypothetical protein
VAVDVSELPQVVERLTGLGQLGPYECEQVYQPVAPASKGIWRVYGNGWSVVLKPVGHGEGQHPNRRPVRNRSTATAGAARCWLTKPACSRLTRQGPGAIWSRSETTTRVTLWLEDVSSLTPATALAAVPVRSGGSPSRPDARRLCHRPDTAGPTVAEMNTSVETSGEQPRDRGLPSGHRATDQIHHRLPDCHDSG